MIRLTGHQWKHILTRHPEISEPEMIKEAVLNPDAILLDRKHGIFDYYRIDRDTGNHIRVVVRRLDGEGFIVTAYLIRKVRRAEREIVYERDRAGLR